MVCEKLGRHVSAELNARANTRVAEMLLTDLPTEILSLIANQVAHPKYIGCLLLAEKQLYLKNREIVRAIRTASILLKRQTTIQDDCWEALLFWQRHWDGRGNAVLLRRFISLRDRLEEGVASLAKFEQVAEDDDGIGLALSTISNTATDPRIAPELRVVIQKLRRCGNWRRRT